MQGQPLNFQGINISPSVLDIIKNADPSQQAILIQHLQQQIALQQQQQQQLAMHQHNQQVQNSFFQGQLLDKQAIPQSQHPQQMQQQRASMLSQSPLASQQQQTEEQLRGLNIQQNQQNQFHQPFTKTGIHN